MFELIISAICAVLGTVLLVIGIGGIIAVVNYKSTKSIDMTEFLIDLLMISFGVFLLTF